MAFYSPGVDNGGQRPQTASEQNRSELFLDGDGVNSDHMGPLRPHLSLVSLSLPDHPISINSLIIP